MLQLQQVVNQNNNTCLYQRDGNIPQSCTPFLQEYQSSFFHEDHLHRQKHYLVTFIKMAASRQQNMLVHSETTMTDPPLNHVLLHILVGPFQVTGNPNYHGVTDHTIQQSQEKSTHVTFSLFLLDRTPPKVDEL